MISNPILSGFNPDPSIVRVGDDYYIATSTFEWFPGVQIHHSKDLKNWKVLPQPLDRVSQLDMKGAQHSGGVWAPCLTHADGLFWLIYTNVRSHGGPVTDSPNYLVTAESVEGPWSEPVYLNASGFDPSLYHHSDGKKYLLNMVMGGPGPEQSRFNGIVLQEYDHDQKKLVGPIHDIWKGTEKGITEGPHIYERDDAFYLLTAEGGTALRHAVSLARSESLFGPYEGMEANPMLTAEGHSELVIQSSGHGDLVQTQDGEWYLVHLCHRPILQDSAEQKEFGYDGYYAPLGRETAIQKVIWNEGEWPRLANGSSQPEESIEGPKLPEYPWPVEPTCDHFDGDRLSPHFQFLREPAREDWLSLSRRSGYLSLKGRDSLMSRFDQSLVARRRQHFVAEVETCLSFDPQSDKQIAGIIAYYDREHYVYFYLTRADEGHVKLCRLRQNLGGGETLDYSDELILDQKVAENCHLKLSLDYEKIDLAWSEDGEVWHEFENDLNAGFLGDWCSPLSNFTGSFVGICAQDMTGEFIWADFDYFNYRPLD